LTPVPPVAGAPPERRAASAEGAKMEARMAVTTRIVMVLVVFMAPKIILFLQLMQHFFSVFLNFFHPIAFSPVNKTKIGPPTLIFQGFCDWRK
jgi:hypothetical protein